MLAIHGSHPVGAPPGASKSAVLPICPGTGLFYTTTLPSGRSSGRRSASYSAPAVPYVASCFLEIFAIVFCGKKSFHLAHLAALKKNSRAN